jgi:hypothetical protein
MLLTMHRLKAKRTTKLHSGVRTLPILELAMAVTLEVAEQGVVLDCGCIGNVLIV